MTDTPALTRAVNTDVLSLGEATKADVNGTWFKGTPGTGIVGQIAWPAERTSAIKF